MNLPCEECLVFTLCKNRYQYQNVIFCDLLHDFVFNWKDDDWYELRRLFSNNKIQMVALESLERRESGTICYSKLKPAK